jgi:hypothetical protein
MFAHARAQRDDAIERRLGDGGLVASVDHAMGEMEQEIDDPRRRVGGREQAVEVLAGLGADAG